jgi:hypothetical protein
MPMVMIKCPHTARSISTGIEVETLELGRLPDVAMTAQCGACGMSHAWRRDEAWLADYAGQAVTRAPAILRTSRRLRDFSGTGGAYAPRERRKRTTLDSSRAV